LLSITLKQSQVDLKSYKGLSSHFKQCQITSNDFKNFSTFADVVRVLSKIPMVLFVEGDRSRWRLPKQQGGGSLSWL
jgi:hypothetical protein